MGIFDTNVRCIFVTGCNFKPLITFDVSFNTGMLIRRSTCLRRDAVINEY